MNKFKRLITSTILLVSALCFSCSKTEYFFEFYFEDEKIDSITMFEGQEIQLDVVTNASDYIVESSGSGLIVEYGGYLKAKSCGEYKAVFKKDSTKEELNVTIDPYIPLEKFESNFDKYVIKVGQSKNLDLNYLPETASDKTYSYSVDPFDGNVYISDGKIHVLEDATPGMEYEITLTNERSTLMTSFKLKISEFVGKVAWTIADSIFDFRDNFPTDMVQTILNEQGVKNENMFFDNIAGSTVKAASNVGIIEHIDNHLYEGWAEPDLVIIARGTNDAYYSERQPTFFTDEAITDAIEKTAKYFSELCPNARVIWATPFFRIDVSEQLMNQIRTKIHNSCSKYGVEVFDVHLAGEFAKMASENFGSLLIDGIHLNEQGVIEYKKVWKEYFNSTK